MIDPIRPHDPIKTKHVNAGIEAYNSLEYKGLDSEKNTRISITKKQNVKAAPPVLALYHPFEVLPDLTHPLATVANPIICAGGRILKDETVREVAAKNINWTGAVWLNIDEYGIGEISQTSSGLSIKLADIADGLSKQRWRSDVCLSSGTGGTAYSFDPLNFNVSGSDVGFKLPTRHLDNTATEHPMQKLQIKAPLTLSGFLENGKTVIELGLDEDYGGGATGYTGEVYIPAYAQDGGSTSHYIAQDFENGLLKRISNETPVGYPPDWPSA